jgi:hypothetical protein
MDAIENGTILSRRPSKHWNIFLTSLFDHLYVKTKSRKLGPTNMLIIKENQVMVAWVLSMQKVGLSLNLQQLKMKVAKLIQTRPTPFRRGVPWTSWWY